MEQANTTRYVKGDFITVPNKNAIKPLKATTQAVFMWIASYADDEGQCYPSRRTIASNCGITIQTVDTHIKKLVEVGLLEKTVRKDGKENKTNIYQILLVGVGKKLDGGVAKKTILGSQKNHTENYTTELNHKYIATDVASDFNLEESLTKMESVPNSHLDHIATYIRYKKMPITNSKQLSACIVRNAKIASHLKGFTSKQLYDVMDKLQEEQEYRLKHKGKADNWTWGLETVLKTLLK